ncbi:Crp/FNR family transcriptional regulator [Novosphingobium sp. PP1Y]|nr:Crp/FNR family transcriptional regulator [Novosphingobium sp. PP1Y]
MRTPKSAGVDCETCQARVDGLCAGYSAGTVEFISGYRSNDRYLKAGQDLLNLGEPCDAIFNLIDGWMFRYTILADGRRQILDFALPGAMLGLNSPLGAPMTFGAQALTDVVVCVIPHKALGHLSQHQPDLGLRLALLMARERSLSFDHLTSIGRRSAHERIARLLLELFVRSRAGWPGYQIEEMHLPVTQEHIGDATGLTGVHVNRVLRDLANADILKFCYRRLSILEPDKLMDLAGIDQELLQSWTGSGRSEARAQGDFARGCRHAA